MFNYKNPDDTKKIKMSILDKLISFMDDDDLEHKIKPRVSSFKIAAISPSEPNDSKEEAGKEVQGPPVRPDVESEDRDMLEEMLRRRGKRLKDME